MVLIAMFVSEVDDGELRQGDIIQDFFFPILGCSTIELAGTPHWPQTAGQPLTLYALEDPRAATNKKLSDVFAARMPVVRTYCIVLSQCCDLALRNGEFKQPTFLLSRLRARQEEPLTGDALKERIRKNALLEVSVGRWFVPSHPPLDHDYQVDFREIAAVQAGEYSHAVRSRVLRMTDAERVKLKLKLGHFFSRATEEELAAGVYSRPGD